MVKQLYTKSKSKHINSKSDKHKEKIGVVVKEYEFFKPHIDEVTYILKDTFEDCRNKEFCSFENICVFDIKYTNMYQKRRSYFINYTLIYEI